MLPATSARTFAHAGKATPKMSVGRREAVAAFDWGFADLPRGLAASHGLHLIPPLCRRRSHGHTTVNEAEAYRATAGDTPAQFPGP